MGTTPEARWSATVREGLRAVACDVEPLENRSAAGTPDLLIGIDDQFVLIELKVVTRGRLVGLRPHQVSFAARHARMMRPTWILVRSIPEARVLLYAGRQALRLQEIGTRLDPVFKWPDGSVDWGALADTLVVRQFCTL